VFELLAEPPPSLDKRSLVPYASWFALHRALELQTPPDGRYAAFVAGRISPEPYQFAPLARLLSGPRRSLLIADDVGLGKTIEAGICLLELIARGVGRRILLVVPPGLIPQWVDEMHAKFGLEFRQIENSAAVSRAQTDLAEGLQPWVYFERVITSTEYLKRRDVHAAALAHPWDVIVVDEAHYLAESGTPANPYSTARTRLGPKLREAARALILLTATPHNGYRHSFRSLLELVDPADATLHGAVEAVQRRVGRSMIRRLKPQIVKARPDGSVEPAFPAREPIRRIEVANLSEEEKAPIVRLENEKIVARHARSFALEELNEDFSWLMGELLEDLQNPANLKRERYAPLVEALTARADEIAAKAGAVFAAEDHVRTVVEAFPAHLEAVIAEWHRQVVRLYAEFREFARIVPSRESEQKRRARLRAYAELTTDREKAFVLSYLSEVGVLPSYQFPTDTFSLDPGVGDTPTLRRPAWIALFEFAPGNMVYANGHKLKSIRAFFDGGRRSGGAGADESGRVERFYFCGKCGFATNSARNECPGCRIALMHADIALVDSFEAEENTQITSAEDSRQRVLYRRAENLLDSQGGEATIYPYEFVSLEFRSRARLLVTNWGRQSRRDDEGEKFELCPTCGRHRPHGLTEKRQETWDTNHANICTGTPRPFVLGYEFPADVLVLSIPAEVAPPDKDAAKSFCRTLGRALVVGAQEVLEIEPDEIAYFQHADGDGGWTLVFYETAPGGAGYLEQLAANLRPWAAAAQERLYNHDCERACYRCLKSARNQFDHGVLDKEGAVRSFLFQLAEAQATGERRTGRAGEGREAATQWLRAEAQTQYQNTPIEQALLAAIRDAGRLPEPVAQHPVTGGAGAVLTVPDFAYPERKIAIYCDDFAYHGDRDALESDAGKRNQLQSDGWAVLTFWGRQILRNPQACEAQIARCYEHREANRRRAA
jgi:hypothetical protein